MKRKLLVSLSLAAMVFLCTMCTKKTVIEMDFYRSVLLSASSAKAGDEVTAEMGGFNLGSLITITTSSSINGKNPVKCVDYFVDGILNASSEDEDNNYKVTLMTDGLSVGEHTVSAKAIPNGKDTTINGNISSAVLTITE